MSWIWKWATVCKQFHQSFGSFCFPSDLVGTHFTMMLPFVLTCLCGGLLASGQPNEHGDVQHDETIHDTENDGSMSFTAAVYQHDTLNWLLPSISREEALRLMNINVDTYEEQIITAASKVPEWDSEFFVYKTNNLVQLLITFKMSNIFVELSPSVS